MAIGNFLEMMSQGASRLKSGANRARDVMEEKQRTEVPHYDLTIQFIGASGLPRMDVGGNADPYFIATIDDQINFTSSIQSNTLNPVWNDLWRVKNVPSTATLKVRVFDKDEGPTDDFIGKFEVSVAEGAKEVEIEGVLRRVRGRFWLKISAAPSVPGSWEAHPYLFDGPVRYSRHNSPTVGRLTNLNDARLYSTWKMYLRDVPLFFGGKTQHWNTEYQSAREIFAGPASFAVRSGIQAGHRLLYARRTTNAFGVIDDASDVYALLWGGRRRASAESGFEQRVKPAVYTYVIATQDNTLRFSETGAAFFVDFASKHALHSNCAESVWYSGEFHPRPAGGWAAFSDSVPDTAVRWELVVDNNSGTYAPDKAVLPRVQDLLEFNFPGFVIRALDREDEELKRSVRETREYAVAHRGVKPTDLQPHKAEDGEETLSQVSRKVDPEQALERAG